MARGAGTLALRVLEFVAAQGVDDFGFARLAVAGGARRRGGGAIFGGEPGFAAGEFAGVGCGADNRLVEGAGRGP